MHPNKILFITRHDPSKNGGGCYATRAYLEALIKIYPNKVTLFVGDLFDKEIITGGNLLFETVMAKPLNKSQFIKGLFLNKYLKFDKVLRKNLIANKYDLAILDGSIIGGSYAKLLKKNKIKTITIHHNQEVEYHRDNKTKDAFWGYYLGWIKSVEKKAYLLSDKNLFLTNADQFFFEKKYGVKKNFLIGCFEFYQNLIYKEPQNICDIARNDKKKIVISGTLSAIQTKNSIINFINTSLPKIYAKFQYITITIAGRNPDNELLEICKKNGIEVVVSPIDMLKTLSEFDIYLCPVNLGGGLKLRIMDALKVGLPSLIQNKSFRGYEELNNSFIKSYEDENDICEALLDLLKKINTSPNYKKTIIADYNALFSFESGVKRFEEIIKSDD